jgi:hypothetical protein
MAGRRLIESGRGPNFIPLVPCRWLIVVAPQVQSDGRPDEPMARAFMAGLGRGSRTGSMSGTTH